MKTTENLPEICVISIELQILGVAQHLIENIRGLIFGQHEPYTNCLKTYLSFY